MLVTAIECEERKSNFMSCKLHIIVNILHHQERTSVYSCDTVLSILYHMSMLYNDSTTDVAADCSAVTGAAALLL
jgi:hypothetical protein